MELLIQKEVTRIHNLEYIASNEWVLEKQLLSGVAPPH